MASYLELLIISSESKSAQVVEDLYLSNVIRSDSTGSSASARFIGMDSGEVANG